MTLSTISTHSTPFFPCATDSHEQSCRQLSSAPAESVLAIEFPLDEEKVRAELSSKNISHVYCLPIPDSGLAKYPEEFTDLLALLQQQTYRSFLHLFYDDLKEEQKRQLHILGGINAMKGLCICNCNNELGIVEEHVYLNHAQYNQEKGQLAGGQKRWSFFRALELISSGSTSSAPHNLGIVGDFGCGEWSPELSHLLDSDEYHWQEMHAIDCDRKALDRFAKRYPDESRLQTFAGPFIEFDFRQEKKVNLFLSQFTLPYRCQDQFLQVWNKFVALTAPGGILAFQLFSRPKDPDEGMSYHTLEEAIALAREVGSYYELVIERHDGSGYRLIGQQQIEGKARYNVSITDRKEDGSSRIYCECSETLLEHWIENRIEGLPKGFQNTLLVGGEKAPWGDEIYHLVVKKRG